MLCLPKKVLSLWVGQYPCNLLRLNLLLPQRPNHPQIFPERMKIQEPSYHHHQGSVSPVPKSCRVCLTDFNQVQNVVDVDDDFRNEPDYDTFHPHISSEQQTWKKGGAISKELAQIFLVVFFKFFQL